MRVVILTSIPFWHPGTQELIDELRKKEVNVCALDIFHGRSINESNEYENLIPGRLTGLLARVYMKLFRHQFIKKHTQKGDILDIHFVEPLYRKYLSSLKRDGIKLISTLFGSDLYRTDQLKKKLQSEVFEASGAILLSQNMVEYFEQYFPDQAEKYFFNQYGSKRLNLINEQNTTEKRIEIREKYKIGADQIAVTCGYNAIRQQQHLLIIDQVEKLPKEYKDKLVLIFPLTYGGDESYKEEIRTRLSQSNISHILFDSRLTDEELVETKLISDITINMQTSDALASSIKEAMVAEDIMIWGEWLPYDIYADLGIFYSKVSFESLTEKLQLIIDNFEEFYDKSAPNRDKILGFASWEAVIGDWIKLYRQLGYGSQ